MIKKWYVALLFIGILSCRKEYNAPVPVLSWNLFVTPASTELNEYTRSNMEGIYAFTEGAETFGNDAALKWSYSIKGTDTTYHLSMFCERQVVYVICEGKRLDSIILLNGYWRNMVNTETGIARFTIADNDGARALLDSAHMMPVAGVKIRGVFGLNESLPEVPVVLQYERPLYHATPLEIIAHRGGGRTADLLPASENSVEMIHLASRLGATGIEIDVRLTKDGVPVLYHDVTLNERLIQKNGMIGPIENYSYAQLKSLVRLIKGEHIPTLRESLDAVLHNTALRYVWLDTKFKGNMQILRNIQVEYQQKAAAMGRDVLLEIGIPDEDVLKEFKALQNFQDIPSICELTVENVNEVNSNVWAPRWTLGLQNEQAGLMQSAGRRVFVWTLDVPENISKYMNEGRFNGILSNYPSAVAYYYYAKR